MLFPLHGCRVNQRWFAEQYRYTLRSIALPSPIVPARLMFSRVLSVVSTLSVNVYSGAEVVQDGVKTATAGGGSQTCPDSCPHATRRRGRSKRRCTSTHQSISQTA